MGKGGRALLSAAAASGRLRLLCLLACFALGEGIRRAIRLEKTSSVPSAAAAAAAEPLSAKVFGTAFTAFFGLLVLQLLMMPRRWKEVDGPANTDPTMTWREDNGKSKLVPLHHPRREGAPPLPKFTLDEVAKHCTMDDLWVCIDERAYDLTKFAARHPGGIGPVRFALWLR